MAIALYYVANLRWTRVGHRGVSVQNLLLGGVCSERTHSQGPQDRLVT